MKRTYPAQALTVYVGEDDHWHGKPLYAVLVDRLRDAGLDGVTVFHGIEGYGAHHKVHTERIEALFLGLPVVIRAVDTPDKIAAVQSLLDEMLSEALVTVQDVQATRYTRTMPS